MSFNGIMGIGGWNELCDRGLERGVSDLPAAPFGHPTIVRTTIVI